MRNGKGFTLMEVMVVVFIIAILVAAAVPSYLDNMRKTRYNESLVAMHKVAQAAKSFRADNPNLSVYGAVTDTLTNVSGTCNPQNGGGTAMLYQCGYMVKDNWDTLAFSIFVCDPASGAGGPCCQQGAYACMKYRTGGNSNYKGIIRSTTMELCEPSGDIDGKNATDCN